MAHQAAGRVADEFALRILAFDDDGLQVGNIAKNAQRLQCVGADDFIVIFDGFPNQSDELRVAGFRQIRDDQRLRFLGIFAVSLCKVVVKAFL